MNPTLQIEKVVVIRESDDHNEERHAVPTLQVEWSSRWQEFRGSIGPALKRSESRLAGEAPFGLIPLRIMIPSYVVEAFLIFATLAIQVKIAELRPKVAPRFSAHDVIYYTGDELPRTQDFGGAEMGTPGRAGGDEAYHRTQTIKVARGASLVPRVVDAPNLKLPSSNDPVANLLAVHADPGPPPAEGLRSSRSAVNLTASIVAPAPNVIRDYTRNGVQLDTVIAPAPVVTRDRTVNAPTLSTTLIPPAPNVSGDRRLVAPALAPTVIPPAPNVARERRAAAPSLNSQIVAPAPQVARDQLRSGVALNERVVAPAPSISGYRARSTPALSGSVIPPAPGAVSGEMSRAPVQMTSATVPPPVTAPERATSRKSLTLPAPAVVAPPPSADLSQDMRRLAVGRVDPGRTVVPPPPSQPAGGSFMSGLIGKLFGTSEVVPPPPALSPKAVSGTGSQSLAANVVPPPPTMTEGGNPRGSRGGLGTSLGATVVAPPPSVGAAAGNGSNSRWTGPTMSSPNVVPPPPTVGGAGGGTGDTPGGKGITGGLLLTNNVVPPPPSVGGGSSSSGSGLGRKGASLGAPTDVGSALAAPHTGGSGANAGAVISSQPGTKVGAPTTKSAGSIAMSPTGGERTGLGGAGGGTGIATGTGSGTAMTGSGSGAAKSGVGRGAETTAREGISTSNGPGGAGNISSGNPPVRNVDISGGSTIVTIPGFGSDPATNDPSASHRTAIKQPQTLGVTIVATASSGGAFEPYKKLLHGEVYTTYLDTSLGTVVMEFAESAPGVHGSTSAHGFAGSLSAPSAIRTDLSDGLPHARMVVACTLDTSGNLKNPHVLEPGPAVMTAKVIAALRSWKFQPAMRNNQPVEVTAILGFGINTDDRF